MNYIDLASGFYKVDIIKVSKKSEKNDLSGFCFQRNGLQAEFLCKKYSVFTQWLEVLSKYCIMSNFNDKYRILSIIGSGGYGKVRPILLRKS